MNSIHCKILRRRLFPSFSRPYCPKQLIHYLTIYLSIYPVSSMGPQCVESASSPQILSKKSISELSKEEWSIVLKEEPFNDPKPAIERFTILMIGLVVFVLATIWPPLILLVTYVASMLLPYSFRINDNPVARRQLLDKFEKEDTISACMRDVPEDITLKTGYWTNSRYVGIYTG